MKANKDDDNGITNNIQEICMTILHRYITHNQINTNIDVKNDAVVEKPMRRGYIGQNTNMKYSQQLDGVISINIIIHTPL